MMFRRGISQKGFSLPQILIVLAIAAIVVLVFLPRLFPGTNIDILNQVSARAKAIVSSIEEQIGGIGDKLGGVKTKLTRKIQELADKWNLEKISNLISEIVAYRLTPESLKKMEAEGMPPEIVDNLGGSRSLGNREFSKDRAVDFWATVKSQIGEDATEQYRDIIEKSTAVRVEDRWVEDMDKLIRYAKANGYDMTRIEELMDLYRDGEASWKRVESEFWNDIREQTRSAITTSIERFRTRPLGCSDFTVEMRKIWDIGEVFNTETMEGYIAAKALSEELLEPRSEQFLNEFLHWLEVANIHSSSTWSKSWLLQQLRIATTLTAEGAAPNYPAIISQLDSQSTRSAESLENVLKDIVVAEIFLQYDLINPAEDRFDEATRNFARLIERYQQNGQYSQTTLGLHMAMGLLQERVCKNRDLAIKEFKDVIAIARRIGSPCQEYSQAHHHLGVLSMNIRAGQVDLTFEETSSSNNESTQDQLTVTPIPVPTASPVPTATPIIKLTKKSTTTTEEEWIVSRGKIERPVGEGTPQPTPIDSPQPVAAAIEPVAATTSSPSSGLLAMGGMKGDIYAGDPRRLERDIRLSPRKELGDTVKMKKFDVNDLYDLSKIPDDAAREFEQYLQCINTGDRATIARFIHNKYITR